MINPLAGKRLRYLIGAESAGDGSPDCVTVAPYGERPAKRGISIGYCNLFDEKNTGKFGPYLRESDTAEEYDEGQIDPRGDGWRLNLRIQFERRSTQGFQYVELDNPDAYSIEDVIGAIDLAAGYGLKVIAKNPLLMEEDGETVTYIAHPNVWGSIVEKGSGRPLDMDALRQISGKSDLPVWFVSFGTGKNWARGVSSSIQTNKYQNMSVSYSARGEYETSQDI